MGLDLDCAIGRIALQDMADNFVDVEALIARANPGQRFRWRESAAGAAADVITAEKRALGSWILCQEITHRHLWINCRGGIHLRFQSREPNLNGKLRTDRERRRQARARAPKRLVKTRRSLQFRRILKQLDHPLQQPTTPAAIETAVIETQCQLRFGSRDKFVFRFVPNGSFFPGSEPKKQSLVRQRNWRPPFDSETPEIGNGSDSA